MLKRLALILLFALAGLHAYGGDWSKPALTDTYANFRLYLDDRLNDVAKGNDPAIVTLSNTPTNAIRWNSASTRWQKYNGSAWNDLANPYSINIGGNAATATTASAVPWSGITSKPTTVGGYGITDAVTTAGGQTIAGNLTISGNVYLSGTTRYLDYDGTNYVLPGAELVVNGVQVAKRVPGTIEYYAGSTAPTGYLECNGAAVSRTTYAALFSVLGTTYGAGDGSTTFNLPDARGEFVRGWDHGRGVDSSRTLGSTQGFALQDHVHYQGSESTYNDYGGGSYVGARNWAGGSLSNFRNQWTSGAQGATTAGETRPRNIAFMCIIEY